MDSWKNSHEINNKILIVEDSLTQAEQLRYILEEHDYNVMVAHSSEEAVFLINEDIPSIIVSDIVMPGMNGFEFCKFIKNNEKFQNIPVILLTTLSEPDDIMKSLECGADNFITKPYDEEHLIYQIQYLLANFNLKKTEKTEIILDINIANKRYRITSDRIQILNLLLSSYESVSKINKELARTQDELRNLNLELDKKVKERTEELESAIKEQNRVQALLEIALSDWRITFDAMQSPICLIDSKRTIKKCNKSLAKLLNMPLVDIIGKNCCELIHNPPGPIDGCPFEKMQKTLHRESLVLKDNDKWFNFIAEPVFDNKGNLTGAVHIMNDITENKKLEAQFMQMQKMEAIGNLAGGVAHDFNNILTIIKGYSELLLEMMNEDDPYYEYIKEINKAGEHAANLTRQLLVFSRKQVLQAQRLNLNGLVTNMEKMLKRVIGEDIKLIITLEPDLANVNADAGQIEQVLMNLIVNARDAMPDGGVINISTSNVTIDEEYARMIPYSRAGSFIYISIEDSGAGIDGKTIEHIFEPFFTTKGQGKGTGLGLSTVYGIIKQHEGWINVYSEPGAGTIFKIHLPVFTDDSEKTTKEKEPLNDVKGNGERILIVEDQDALRNLTVTLLKKNNYTVVEAESAEEGIELFTKENGNFDLVFTDIVLTDKSGIAMSEEILAFKPDAKIIFTSGYTEEKSQLAIIQKKGYKFIQKPYHIMDLLKLFKEK